MSNDKTSENNELDPTVQAVVNALNDKSKFEASFIKQNLAEQTQVEELLDDNSIYVDIYEENGQIVGIDNGVLFDDEELPGIEFVEKYLGPDYVDGMLNEFLGLRSPTGNDPKAVEKRKKEEAAKKTRTTATAPRSNAAAPAGRAPAAAPAGRAPGPVNMMAQSGRQQSDVQAAARPAAGGAANTSSTSTTTRRRTRQQETPASRRTEAGAKKEDKPSTTASSVTQRARETKLDTGNLDLAIGDQLKATDQVVSQNIKDAAAKMKPGEVKKAGFIDRFFRGKGGTYTPGDVSAFDSSTKDFTKKVADAAAKIKTDRDIASKPWETKGSEPGPTDGGKDVLDQLEKDTAAVGGGGADQTPAADGGAATAPAGSRTRAGGKPLIPIRFQVAGEGEVDETSYRKRRESGDIASQDVVFNVRNKKTGELRQVRKGVDPEYDQYYASYERMKRAVKEAMIRMGAILTEEGWTLNGELLESVYTEYAPVEMTSSYYYDSTGRLRIMTESEWAQLGLANVILERAIMEAMDEVGKEDEDVDNDGDSDSSDDYLKNRREKIAAKMKEKLDEKVSRNLNRSPQKPTQPTRNLTRPAQKPVPKSAESNLKNRNVAAQNRMKEISSVPMPDRVKGIPAAAANYIINKRLNASTIDPKKLADQQMSTQDAVALGATAAQALNTPLKSGGKGSGSSFLNKVAGNIKSKLAGSGNVAALGNEIAGDNIPEYDATNPKPAQPRKSAMMESNPFPWRK